MNRPILVVMAAGLGSRYGGLKQLDQVGFNGETLMEFSIYDAIKAGFKEVVFIICEDYVNEFKEVVGNLLEPFIQVNYAYQKIEDVPKGVIIDKDRSKPLGTAHAIYSAREFLDKPFAVINADDFYGLEAFQVMYKYLENVELDTDEYCMVGYELLKTLTDNGYVSRGVCEVSKQGNLLNVIEREHIEKTTEGCAYLDAEEGFIDLPLDSVVSMNMWGFTPGIIQHIESGFISHFNKILLSNPHKSEYYIPLVVDQIINNKKGSVKVLLTDEKWFGVTYASDKEIVVAALKKMSDEGKYKKPLW